MGSMMTIYKKRNFKIYDSGNNSYIVHNTNLEFSQHHTHINNYRTCVYIIDLCIHKTVPKHLSDYLLVSIIRLTNDNVYRNKILMKLEENKAKKKRRNKYG